MNFPSLGPALVRMPPGNRVARRGVGGDTEPLGLLCKGSMKIHFALYTACLIPVNDKLVFTGALRAPSNYYSAVRSSRERAPTVC